MWPRGRFGELGDQGRLGKNDIANATCIILRRAYSIHIRSPAHSTGRPCHWDRLAILLRLVRCESGKKPAAVVLVTVCKKGAEIPYSNLLTNAKIDFLILGQHNVSSKRHDSITESLKMHKMTIADEWASMSLRLGSNHSWTPWVDREWKRKKY